MWLLNTTSLELEYFVDCRDEKLRESLLPEEARPRYSSYAILSHTWGDGEISFQELNAGSGKEKKGYEKIVKTCEQARKEGCKYAWVDTCCIDKKSSAELSEAINSMWDWYCHAQTCFVYLPDVPGGCPILEDKDVSYLLRDEPTKKDLSRWRAQFRVSRWFTRGWTLQELIAPHTVKFLNHDWGCIGTKAGLVGTLSALTGIDRAVIESRHHLHAFVIARKMSWAVGRKTSRIEDRAYSLLGIFGINMPLLYGEGEKAFTRLQEILVQTSTDHSILVWIKYEERQSHWTLDMDRLFARSPDEFKIGTKVVTCLPDVAQSHHILTSKGLEFHSNRFVKSKSKMGKFMLLNCRFEDNLQGPLALRLSQELGKNSGGLMKWTYPDDYCVESPSDVFVGGFDERLRQSRRLIILPNYATASRQSRVTTVLRYHPKSTFNTQYEGSQAFKIWLQRSKALQEDFEIVRAFPAAFWNISTGIMCWPSPKQVPHVEAAGAVLRFSPAIVPIQIDFSLRWLLSGEAQLLIHLGRISTGEKSPVKVRSFGSSSQVTDEYHNLYSATVEASTAMGDRVHIVRIAEQGPDGASNISVPMIQSGMLTTVNP